MLQIRTDLVLVTAALGAWWLLAVVRASNSVFDESASSALVTSGGFVAIVVIGMTFANDFGVLRNIARGAAAALLVIGGASILVSLGWLAEPDRVAPGREIFGLELPFSRNYGFDLPYDAVALLVPLCVPYYLLALLNGGSRRLERREAALTLALLSFVFVALLQARGMVLQVFVAAVAMSFLVGRRTLAIAGLAALVVGVALGSYVVLTGDGGKSFRIETSLEAIRVTTDSVQATVTGVNEDEVIQNALRDPGLREETRGFDQIPIHNLFLANLVTGGLFSLLALVGVVAYAAVRLLRSDLAEPTSKVLLVAFGLVLIELNIEPIRANVVGAWLILGLALGLRERVSTGERRFER